MPSLKTEVIQYLFDKQFDPRTQSLVKTVVTNKDVAEAIARVNKDRPHKRPLSVNNPANFIKDVIRSRNASNVWPPELRKLGWTALQRTGGGDVFEFVPFKKGQTEPFPDIYRPSESTPKHPVSSLNLPLYSKDLGRHDEPWMVQTAVNLRIVETHFGVYSKQLPIAQITHLQMSVKLRRTEIDTLFLAICREHVEKPREHEYRAIITCEAKQWSERILEEQVVAQAKAAINETQRLGVEWVVPIALQGQKNRGIYLVEFKKINQKEIEKIEVPKKVAEVVYELIPPVPGI